MREQPDYMFKKHFSCALWLGILNLPLAWFYSLSYTPQGNTPWLVFLTFIIALTGQLFIYFALLSIVLILPVFNWRKHIGASSFIYAVVVLALAHLLVNIDTHIFEIYNQHLLDLLTKVNYQTTSFTPENWGDLSWVHWGVQILIAFSYSSVMLAVAIFVSSHDIRCRFFVFLALVMYALASGIFMFSSSRNIQPLIILETHNLPGFINISNLVSDGNLFKGQRDNKDKGETTSTPLDPSPEAMADPFADGNSEFLKQSNAAELGIENNLPEDAIVASENINAEENALSEQPDNQATTENPQATPNAIDSSLESAASAVQTDTQVRARNNNLQTTDEVRDPRDFAPFNR